MKNTDDSDIFVWLPAAVAGVNFAPACLETHKMINT